MKAEILCRAMDQKASASSDFDLNPGVVLPANRILRPAAVLIAAQDHPAGCKIILTKRSSGLKHHPGQIAFPGGKIDAGDANATAAALREAWEEIGLDPSSVQVIGQLAAHETVTGFSVIPVVAKVVGPFLPRPELGEVEEVFSVPLAFLMEARNYRVERRLWRGQWRHFYAVPYGPYYVWGATARILRGLSERLPQ